MMSSSFFAIQALEADCSRFTAGSMQWGGSSSIVAIALRNRFQWQWSPKHPTTMVSVVTVVWTSVAKVCTSFAVDFTNSTTKGWLTKTMNITMGRNCTDGFL